MVSKPLPILLKALPQNKVLKNNIEAKQECFAQCPSSVKTAPAKYT
ncbi:hypothetical protein ID0992_08680 [Helicobacter pylori]